MADTSAILAAGNIGGQQQNPLDTFGKIQGILNSQQQNRLMQQTLVNEQTSNQVAQQGLATNRNTAIGQEAWGLSLMPDDQQTASNYKAAVDRQLALGRIDANTASVWKAQIPEGATPSQYRVLAAQHALGLLQPQIAQQMAGTQGWLNTGNTQMPFQRPGIGMPNQGTPVQTGQAIPISPSPESQNQPEHVWNPDKFGPGNGGYEIQPRGSLPGFGAPPFSQPGAVPPRLNPPATVAPAPGAAAPAGGGPAPATAAPAGGRPAPAVATPGSTPAPATGGATVPVVQAPGPQKGYAIAEPPPGAATEFQTSATQYAADNAASGSYKQRIFPLTQAASLLPTTNTGPSTEWTNSIKSFLVAQTPDILKRIGATPDQINVAKYDELEKYLTQYVNTQPFAAGSDAKLASALTGNPSTHISNLAAQNVVKAAIGLERMKQTAVTEFNATHAPGSGAQYSRYLNTFSNTYDPRAFLVDQMDEKQLASVLKSLKTPAEKHAWKKTVDLIQAHPEIMNNQAMPVGQ